MSTFKERRLVRRLKDRDEAAFSEMVRTYQQRVFSMVYRMLGNREEAEDLAQEVFVTVFKSIESFRGDSKFSTWLYRVTANTCRNRYKYLARRKFHASQPLDDAREAAAVGAGASGVVMPEPVAGPEEALAGKRLEAAIQREIANLEDEHRLLIVLRDIEGLSYQEIASIAELPEGTVKSRLHRARVALKDRLSKYM